MDGFELTRSKVIDRCILIICRRTAEKLTLDGHETKTHSS